MIAVIVLHQTHNLKEPSKLSSFNIAGAIADILLLLEYLIILNRHRKKVQC